MIPSNKTGISRGRLLALLCSVAFAFLPIVSKVGLTGVSAGTLAWSRFLIAGVIFGGISLGAKDMLFRPSQQTLYLVVLASSLLGANHILYSRGIQLGTASNAQIIVQTGALGVALFGSWFFREKLNLHQFIGIIVASLGMYIFYLDQLILTPDYGSYRLSTLVVAISGLAWSGYSLLVKKISTSLKSIQTNTGVFLCGSILLLPFVSWNELLLIQMVPLLSVLLAGILSVAAYYGLAAALKLAPVAEVSLIIAINPILTITFVKVINGYLGLKYVSSEPVGAKGIFGAFIVVLGVGAVILYGKRNRTARLKQAMS